MSPARDPEPAAPDGAVTIYDVARAAGVHASTVSRAFSRPGRVSADTSRRVHEAAERLGYRSQAVYHPPSDRRTRMIALLVSDVTNPYFFAIIRGAENAARATGTSILLVDTQEDQEIEQRLLSEVVPSVDGLVVASSRLSDTALRTAAKQLPVAVLNRQVSGLPCVVSDARQGTADAVRMLLDHGHRRLVYVAGPPSSWANGQRWESFRDTCTSLGLVHHRVGPVLPTVRGGEDVAAAALTRHPTAVICYNDLVAIGLMRALGRHGVRVPEDISVVGFDNTFASDLVTPGLTTVASPLLQLGERAVHTVADQHRRAPHESVAVVPTRLVVRGSTGPAAS